MSREKWVHLRDHNPDKYHPDRDQKIFLENIICLDCNLVNDPEDVPGYTKHSLFNTTKRITLLFIVQSLLRRNPPNI